MIDNQTCSNGIKGAQPIACTYPCRRTGDSHSSLWQRKMGIQMGKWITSIEVTDESYEGYWESRGYSDNADVCGPKFER